MAKQPANQTPAADSAEIIPTSADSLKTLPQLAPVKLSEILQQYQIQGPQVPADQLIDRTFTMKHAKPFNSAFKEGNHAYFVTCIDPETAEVFSTVLGGEAVVSLIDALIQANIQNPVTVTLRFNAGKGRFAGYYTLE